MSKIVVALLVLLPIGCLASSWLQAACGPAREETFDDDRQRPPKNKVDLEGVIKLRKLGGYVAWRLDELGRVCEVELDGKAVTADHLKAMAALAHLRRVMIDFPTSLRGADLIHLEAIRSLRELDIRTTPDKMGDKHVMTLRQLEGLELLSLDGVALTDDGLRHLAGLSRLQVLRITGSRLTFEHIERLEPLKELRLLELKILGSSDFENDDIDAVRTLAFFPKLTKVEVPISKEANVILRRLLPEQVVITTSYKNRIEEEDYEAWRKRSLEQDRKKPPPLAQPLPGGLDELAAAWRRDKEGAVVAAEFGFVLPNKTRAPRAADMKRLAELPNLESVTFYEDSLTDDWLSDLASATQIKRLTLARNPITNDGVKRLQPLKQLTHLNLSNTKIDDRSILAITGLENLEDLDLHNTRVSDSGVEFLSRHKRLRTLHVGNQKERDLVTNDSVLFLSRLKTLRTLDIWFTTIDQKCCEELRVLLPDCKIISRY